MAKGKGAKKAGGPRAPAAQVTPQQLYTRAQVALKHNDYDSARTALRKAVKLAPRNVEYVETLGALLAEVGPEDEALEVLRRAVTLSPDAGFEKYLYLGQLLADPAEALAATRKGVQVLQAAHEAARAAGSPEAAGLSRVLAGALCSLGEALLGNAQVADAAAREAAEAAGGGGGGGGGPGAGVAAVAAEVEHLLALAATANPHSPEPGQVLASLRYEQGRAAEALEALRRSMALWYRPEGKDGEEEGEGEEAGGGGARGRGGGGEDEDMGDAEEAAGGAGGSGADSEDGSDDSEGEGEEEDGPSYEFRMECAKLLLELDETTTTAVDVLEGLVLEDDRVPEAWHLLALALYSGHAYGEAAEALARGQALLAAAGAGPEDDITQEFAELEAAIAEAQAIEAQQAGGGAAAQQ